MTRQATDRKLQSSWLRFSLRGLLLGAAVCSLLSIPFARLYEQARQQRMHVVAITRAGGTVIYRFTQKGKAQLRRVTEGPDPLRGPSPPRTWLRETLGDDFFDRVVRVGFDRSTTPVPFVALVEIETLEHLIIRHRALSAADLESLKQLRGLRVLDLFGCKMSQADYEDLRDALPGCTVLVDLDLPASRDE